VKIGAIHDFDQLRQAALLLEAENNYLHRRLAELTARLERALGSDRANLQMEIELLKEQLAARVRDIYGASSERRPRPKDGQPESSEEDTSQKNESNCEKAQTGHGPRQQSLPVVEEVYELDEADKVCPKCGRLLREMEGQYEESEEVDVVEREFRIRKDRRKKYHCDCGACVETAIGADKLIPGGRYSVRFATCVAIAKYADHMPLQRQVRQMARQGLVVDSQTLWDQTWALAQHLWPTHEAIFVYVSSQPVIGADETTWPLMETGKTTKWWAWAICCDNAVYYRILEHRSAAAGREMLAGYSGIVVADGYGVYGALAEGEACIQTQIETSPRPAELAPAGTTTARPAPAFTLANCWGHVRRKWLEAEHNPAACEVVEMIGELYGVERRAREADVDDKLKHLAELRRTESAEIVRRIRERMIGLKFLDKSALGKAAKYTNDLWPGLTRFLDDPRIPLDNNQTERGMRPLALGRKNHYGSRSVRGTKVAALFYTLIETARLAGREPQAYIREAARRAIRNPGAVTMPWDIDSS